MARTLTLIVGIALAAVSIAPAASAEGRPASLYAPSRVATYRDAFTPIGHPPPYRASEPHRASGPHRGTTATPALAAKPAYTTSPGTSAPAKLAAARAQARLFDGDTKSESATPGRGIEWSRIGVGIGIGIGMALAIGLALAVQTKRARPLPH